MKSADIKQFLALGTFDRMGSSDEVKERWPEIDSKNPKNWKRIAKFKVGGTSEASEEYGDIIDALSDWKYSGAWFEFNSTKWPVVDGVKRITPDCTVRIFELDGSDRAAWIIITNHLDDAIIAVEDIGD